MSSFAIKVPAFEMISILSKLKPNPKFNMEHPDLHPNYVFISYFDTGAHLRETFAGVFMFLYCVFKILIHILIDNIHINNFVGLS
jgi:hypothetical protein